MRVEFGALDGATELHIAARGNGSRIATVLTRQRIDVDVRDQLGRTPLMYAAHAGKEKSVIALLNAGANPKALDHEGRGVLHWIALTGTSHEIARILLARGADPKHKSVDGRSSFHHIAARKPFKSELADMFLERGCQWGEGDKDGLTPLMIYAFVTGKASEVRKICETFGVDLDSRDNDGYGLLDYAIAGGQHNLVSFFQKRKITQVVRKSSWSTWGGCNLITKAVVFDRALFDYFMSLGCDPNAHHMPAVSEAPLHLVKDVEVATILLKAGASTRTRKWEELTPVHCAMERRNLELVKLLVDWDPGCLALEDKYARTPLIYAVHRVIDEPKKYLPFFIELIESELDFNQVNSWDDTPLDYAYEMAAKYKVPNELIRALEARSGRHALESDDTLAKIKASKPASTKKRGPL